MFFQFTFVLMQIALCLDTFKYDKNREYQSNTVAQEVIC